jgi:hypothetical protein
MSGTFPKAMSLSYLAGADLSLPQNTNQVPDRLVVRVGGARQSGLVFDREGTDRALSTVSANGSLKLLEDFSGYLNFSGDSDRQAWEAADQRVKRRCLARNVDEMIKQTDINYRTHGDRLHYLVVGLVEVVDDKGISGDYPLYLFSCTDLNQGLLQADIEQEGFANFWLDRNVLSGTIALACDGYETSIDGGFASHLNTLCAKLNSLELPHLRSVKAIPSYSALTIVTGFDPEYIDPVWERIS